jgi:YHS domain-containing protein/thiol-disulfide isomerase/thioredoxin
LDDEGIPMRASLCGLRGGVLVFALAFPIAVCKAEPRWAAWQPDFETAEAEARELGRPMLVHFHAEWCGPCQEMEHTVLRDPVLLKQLRTGFVAVKVDSDKRPDLRNRFHVERLPTDVFLDPRGYVLHRTSGIHDREEYLELVARIEAQFAQARSTRIASQTKPLSEMPRMNESPIPLGPTPPPVAPDPVGPRSIVRGQVEPVPIAASIGGQPGWDSGSRTSGRRWLSLGMKGFSPVSLATRREWVQGDRQFAAEYKGVVYFLASSDELWRFRENPDRFAPQIMGCDPVILDIADRAVPGNIRYAAYFEGELYLFVSEKSRQIFQEDPHKFIRAKHVLKVDDLDQKCLE